MEGEYRYHRAQTRVGKLSVSTKVFQGVGGVVNSGKDLAFNTLLLLYYSQILGLSASTVSIVIAITLLIDAITDPIVGSMSDNLKSRLGRRHPFMIGSALPFGLALYLLFAPPDGLSSLALTVWLFCVVVMARIAFTFFYVPWSALAAEFSDDYIERTSIITYRYLVGLFGGLGFTLFTWTYLFPNTEEFPSGQLNPDSYPVFGVFVGVVVVVCTLVSSLGTRREIPYLLQPKESSVPFSFRRTLRETYMAFKNRNFRTLFIMFLLFSSVAGVGSVFDIYMNTYFWELSPAELRWLTLSFIGVVLAFATVPRLQRHLDKHTILIWFLSLYMIGAVLKVCFRFWDVWPDNADPMLLFTLVLYEILRVYLLSTAGIMVSSLLADIVDEQELETGHRQEGVFSSVLTFCTKATGGLGLVIGGLLLEHFIAFPQQVDVGEVEDRTLFLLAFIDGVAVPMLLFIPIYLISKVTMTRARLAEVQAALRSLRR